VGSATEGTTVREEQLKSENAELARRVEQLENELVDQAGRANVAIAAAQDRAYWLDRWHLDLNALMRRRGASEVRAALRFARSVVRQLKRFKSTLLGR
jgi:hypothetical protein